MQPFRFGLQGPAAPTMAEWRQSARTAEDLGYSALYVTDHLGAQLAPLVATTVAAEATTTLHVGTLVLNNDLRNPVVLAQEIATLGLAAEDRVEVGLGAGWLGSDYEATGIRHDDPPVRVDRLAESLTIMKALWREGHTSFDGTHYTVNGARCEPRPYLPPRLIVGGGSKRVLALAAAQADTVNVSPAAGGRTSSLAERASAGHFDRCLRWIRDAAGERFDRLELQVGVFSVVVTTSSRAARRAAALLGFADEDAVSVPVLLIGTIDEICERLLERRSRWGFSSVVVPTEAVKVFAPVVARLTGT